MTRTHPPFQNWCLAVRPQTLWVSVAPVIIGTAMAFEAGAGHWLSALAALFGAIMIQIGTNLANDYFDFKKGADAGERLGPLRLTQAGLITPEAMLKATTAAFVLAFLIGSYLVYRGGWPIVIIGLLSILFGVLYTATPMALGYSGLADIFVLIFFGLVAVGGTYYVQTLQLNSVAVIAGIAPGLMAVAILTVNNLRDINSDIASGKKTLTVRFGVTFSKIEYLLSILVASFVPVSLWLITDAHPLAMAASGVAILAIPSFKKVFSRQGGRELNALLPTTARLLLLYSILFSLGWLW